MLVSYFIVLLLFINLWFEFVDVFLCGAKLEKAVASMAKRTAQKFAARRTFSYAVGSIEYDWVGDGNLQVLRR